MRIITDATFPAFEAWVSEHTFVGLHGEVADGALVLLAVADEEGDAWLLDATDRDLLIRALTVLRAGDRELWASDALVLARAIWESRRIRIGGLTDAGTVWRATQPGADYVPDRDAQHAWGALRTQFGGRDWRTRALLESSLRDSRLHRAVTPRAVEAATIAAECDPDEDWVRWELRTEATWRETALRGLRIDVDLLERTLRDAEQIGRTSRREFGVDLSRDSDATRRWLDERSITIRTSEGRDTLSHHAFDDADVPEDAREDFDEFVRIRALTRDAGKLREIRDALRGDRVYPQIDTVGTVTGRFAIRRPALQNLSPGMRGLLLPDEGMVLVGADLSHVEPSIAAALSGDAAMLEAVAPGSDPYLWLAATIWGETVLADDPRRKIAKTALLASLYGQGVESLAQRLAISEDRAREVRAGIDRAFPTFAKWRKRVMVGDDLATFYGRPLPTPRAGEEYKAVNHAVQGSAADFFKRRTLAVAERLCDTDRLYLPIHDELIVQTTPDRAAEVATILTETFGGEIGGVTVEAEGVILGGRLAHA
ncbi:DNA polymerase [Microbacterium lacticum]|uniref:DNA-directed DNA polymerase n=1 Tax=Microbacterium lacticum TaxID=33885 RepID=A0A4Y3UN06_9MICO|nr:DNA polymerase [Microbacterium lacticum]TQM90962.1 DNA polymerase family A [Microbacterium lacticum]GEB96076.1 hypothetical protein MLA01_22950 [Microbacterium lacticum]GGI71683.1 hypothetical protein GCM10009724_23220 [Microbacterium lacticum]